MKKNTPADCLRRDAGRVRSVLGRRRAAQKEYSGRRKEGNRKGTQKEGRKRIPQSEDKGLFFLLLTEKESGSHKR